MDGQAGLSLHRPLAKGMTMVEIMVAMSVLAVAMLLSMVVVKGTSDNMAFELTVSDQQVITRSVTDQLVDELRKMDGSVSDFDTLSGAGADTLTGGNLTAGQVRFTEPSYDLATQTLDPGSAATAITFRWVLSPREVAGNGMDDDGNGLTDNDDGRIERLVGGVPSSLRVLTDHVPQSGFRVLKQGRRLAITIARKNITTKETLDNKGFTTTITHVTYYLKN